jgi:hypothetical protein
MLEVLNKNEEYRGTGFFECEGPDGWFGHFCRHLQFCLKLDYIFKRPYIRLQKTISRQPEYQMQPGVG